MISIILQPEQHLNPSARHHGMISDEHVSFQAKNAIKMVFSCKDILFLISLYGSKTIAWKVIIKNRC